MASSFDQPGFAAGPAFTFPWSTRLQDLVASITPRIDVTVGMSAALANVTLPDFSHLVFSKALLALLRDQPAGTMTVATRLPPSATSATAQTAIRRLGFTAPGVVDAPVWNTLPTKNEPPTDLDAVSPADHDSADEDGDSPLR